MRFTFRACGVHVRTVIGLVAMTWGIFDWLDLTAKEFGERLERAQRELLS